MPVPPDDGHELPVLDGEVYAVEHVVAGAGGAVFEVDVLEFDLPRLSGSSRLPQSGESEMLGSASRSSETRRAPGTARVSISRHIPTMSTLMSTCTM